MLLQHNRQSFRVSLVDIMTFAFYHHAILQHGRQSFRVSLVDITTFAFYHHAICSSVGSLSLIVSGFYDIRLRKLYANQIDELK